MKFTPFFKENLLAYNKKTKEAFKLLSIKVIAEQVYEVKALDNKRKLSTFILGESDIKQFKFIKKKSIGRTVVEFEEILYLLSENNTVAGAFGDGVSSSGADQFSSDWYAKGDARNPWGAMPAKVQQRNRKGIESFMKTRKAKQKKKNSSKKKN